MQQSGPFAASQIDRAPRRPRPAPAPSREPRPFWDGVERYTDENRPAERLARQEALVQGALWDRHRQVEALLGRAVPRSQSMVGAGSGALSDAQYEQRLDALRAEFPNALAGVETRADIAARLSGSPTLVRYDTAEGPAWVRTTANGGLWLETQGGRTGPLSSFPGARPVRVDPDRPRFQGDGSSVSPRERSLGERFTSTAEDMIATSPFQAAGRWLVSRGSQYDEFEDPENPGQTIRYDSFGRMAVETERERRESYQLLASSDAWHAGDASFLQKLLRGTATLGGALGGSATDPTNIIAPGRTAVGRISGAALTNAGLDVAAQGADVATGLQEEYRPGQTVAAGVLGGAIQGGGELVGGLARSANENPVPAFDGPAMDAASSAPAPVSPAVRAALGRIEAAALDDERLGGLDGGTRGEALSALNAGRPMGQPEPERTLSDLFDTGVSNPERGPASVTYQGRTITRQAFDPLDLDVQTPGFRVQAPPADLSSAIAWDPAAAGRSIIWQDRAGQNLVADGRARLELARRLVETGEDPTVRIDATVLRQADGWTADDARMLAAAANLRQAGGSPVDFASLLRSAPGFAEDRALPLGDLGEARALAALSDGAFDRVQRGDLSAELGAVIGDLAPNRPNEHDTLADLLVRAKPRNLDEARAMVLEQRWADVAESYGISGEMFAGGAVDKVVAVRGRLRASVLQALRAEPDLFNALADVAELLDTGTAALGRNAAERAVARDLAVMGSLERLSLAGAGSDVFSEATRRLMTTGRGWKAATEAVVADLRAAVDAMAQADAERSLLLDPPRMGDAARSALEPFSEAGGPGQRQQVAPKPEDAAAEADAATRWDDLPEVGDEERAVEVLRACAPGRG